MEYTKGKWEANDRSGRWGIDCGDIPIADMRENPEANAHLIASAPDLYEACKKAITSLDNIIPADMVSRSARDTAKGKLQQAIAKVEGK